MYAVHVRAKTHSYSMNITITYIHVEYSKSYDKHKTTNLILSEKDLNTYPPNFFRYTELYLIYILPVTIILVMHNKIVKLCTRQFEIYLRTKYWERELQNYSCMSFVLISYRNCTCNRKSEMEFHVIAIYVRYSCNS